MWFVFWVMLKIWWFWFLGGVELGNCKELSFTAIVEGWDRSGIQKNPVVQWTCCL